LKYSDSQTAIPRNQNFTTAKISENTSDIYLEGCVVVMSGENVSSLLESLRRCAASPETTAESLRSIIFSIRKKFQSIDKKHEKESREALLQAANDLWASDLTSPSCQTLVL